MVWAACLGKGVPAFLHQKSVNRVLGARPTRLFCKWEKSFQFSAPKFPVSKREACWNPLVNAYDAL